MTVPEIDRLDSFPEAWRPETGDKLVGTIISLDERENEYGVYPIVTVLTDAGDELSWHAFHTVAKNELAKLEPRVGEQIGIKYHGRDKSDRYERWRVLMLDRDAESPVKTPDWKRMRSETESDQPAKPESEQELPPSPPPTVPVDDAGDDIPF